MIGVQPQTLVDLIVHKNGINEFVINNPSRKAVDELFAHINRIHSEASEGDILRFLIVQKENMGLPIRHTMSRVREYKPRWTHPSRSVMLMDTNPLMRTMIQVFETLQIKQSEEQFMSIDQRDDAIEWLLAE